MKKKETKKNLSFLQNSQFSGGVLIGGKGMDAMAMRMAEDAMYMSQHNYPPIEEIPRC